MFGGVILVIPSGPASSKISPSSFIDSSVKELNLLGRYPNCSLLPVTYSKSPSRPTTNSLSVKYVAMSKKNLKKS